MNSSVVGIIGGTGLYDLDSIEITEQVEVQTPYGAPSSPVSIAEVDGLRLLFLARHGLAHSILPSEINYAANIYALKSLGAQWCLSVSAVGSLQEEYRPGDIVLPTQYIDRTKQRANTLFGEGVVVHVPFADPVCPVLHELLAIACETTVQDQKTRVQNTADEAGREQERRIIRRGTYVCMEGPAFSTRAESQWYRSMAASVIGMTALPEAKFAREAELSYATMATVTDYDCWRSDSADIDVPELLATMKSNVRFVKEVLKNLIPALREAKQPKSIANALATSLLTPLDSLSDERRNALKPFLAKYLPQ